MTDRLVQLLGDVESELVAFRQRAVEQGPGTVDPSAMALVHSEALRLLAALRTAQKVDFRRRTNTDVLPFVRKQSWPGMTLEPIADKGKAARRCETMTSPRIRSEIASSVSQMAALPQMQPLRDGQPVSGGTALFTPRTRKP
eukprot:m51a1_g7431 hypothetical protein (142) ;mRNA; f:43568-43993